MAKQKNRNKRRENQHSDNNKSTSGDTVGNKIRAKQSHLLDIAHPPKWKRTSPKITYFDYYNDYDYYGDDYMDTSW